MTWWFVLLALCAQPGDSGHILALCTTVSHSHSLWCYQFMEALVERGHHVTVFGLDKPSKEIANLTTFIAEGVYQSTYNSEVIETFTRSKSLLKCMTNIIEQNKISSSTIIHSKGLQDLLKEYKNITRPFDIIIHDNLMCFACAGLVHHFGNPPLILATTYGIPEWWMFDIGHFPNPAYVRNILLPLNERMTFYERLYNMYSYILSYYIYKYEVIPMNNRLIQEVFGSDVPSLTDINRRANIILGNYNFMVDGARPLLPGVIPILGLHIRNPQRLPKDLKNIMDSADDGVILISFGSNVGKEWLPKDIEETLTNAFKNVNQTVLWKWDSVPNGLPKNVHVRKWLPLVDILAHPKIALFITHCGILSTQEAMVHGVPLLSMPVFLDQHANAQRLHAAGVSLTLDVFTVTAEVLRQTALELIQKRQYKTNMKRLGELMTDTPLTPQQQAVYWTEYAIRHAGAPQLHSPSADMPWYQLFLLDVLAILIIIPVAIVFLIKLTIVFLIKLGTRFFRQKLKSD